MRSLILAVVAGLAAHAAAINQCNTYKTVTKYYTPAVRTIVGTTTRITSTASVFYPTIHNDVLVTIQCTTTKTLTVGSVTVTKNGGTTTIGGTKTVTTFCPKSTCDCYTTRTTTTTIRTSALKTSTVLYTDDVTTVDATTGFVTSTITTGSPPTTVTTLIATTPKFVTDSITLCSQGFETVTKTKTAGTQTVTLTRTVSILPTATHTLSVFSIQAYNTSVSVDDYTFALRTSAHVLELQRFSVGEFYIDPDTKYLYEYHSRRHAVYFDDGGDADYGHEWIFVKNGEIDPEDAKDYPYVTCSAECGGPLKCVGIGDLAINKLRLGQSILFDNANAWPPIFVKAVGPTKGRY